MKKLALPLIAIMLFALAACGDDEGRLKNLNGAWVVDVKTTVDLDPTFKNMAQAEKDVALGMVSAMLEAISMEFDVPNKKVTAVMGPNKESSDFTVESVNGDVVVINSDGQKATIEFKGDDNIIFTSGQENPVAFKRK